MKINIKIHDCIPLMIIGFGPHAKRIYYPVVKNIKKDFNIQLMSVVDLESKKIDIEDFFLKNDIDQFKKPSFIFIPENKRTFEKLHPEIEKVLSMEVKKKGIKAVIISTEPMVHVQYARWALKEGLHIMMDKPLSVRKELSTNIVEAKRLIDEYQELEILLEKKRSAGNFIVFDLMAQRRFHPALLLIQNLIKEVYIRTNMPVSSITSVHSDGQWRMPSEIIEQNYHPYNQGYGKSSHSGYHTIDIGAWLIETTTKKDKLFDNIDVFSNFLRPSDFYEQLNLDDYRKIFSDYDIHNKYSESEFKNKFCDMGEIDAFVSLGFRRGVKTSTLVNLSMIHNGSAQRNWPTSVNRDLYKGNGRIRHESHYVVQGPFQAISFISYQSKELNPDDTEGLYDMGGEYHLDINVFRNNVLFPDWDAYKKYTIKDLSNTIMEGRSRGHQEDARRNCLINFFQQILDKNINNKSSLQSHKVSVLLHSAIYQSACARYSNKNPLINIKVSRN